MADDPGGIYGMIKGQFDACKAYADEAFDKVKDYLDELNLIARDDALPYVTDSSFNIIQPHIESPPWINPPAKPTIPALDMPAVNFNFDEIPYSSEVFDEVADYIIAQIQLGGTGLSAEVEAALWSRARARTALENARLRDQLENAIAAKGWTLPPGALQSAITESMLEETRANADINDKIMIQSSDLAQKNLQFAVTAGIQLEGQSKEYASDVMNRAIERAKSLISSITEVFKVKVMYITAQLDIYKGDVEAFKAVVQAAGIELESQVEVFKAQVTQARNQTELLLKAAEINLTAFVQNRGLLLEVAKGGSNVFAQLAASALNAIHAGANLGYQGSTSYSHDETRAIPTTSTETVYQHTYKE